MCYITLVLKLHASLTVFTSEMKSHLIVKVHIYFGFWTSLTVGFVDKQPSRPTFGIGQSGSGQATVLSPIQKI